MHQRYWPVAFFSCVAFVWFLNQGDAGLIKMSLGVFLLLLFFGKSLRGVGITASLNVW